MAERLKASDFWSTITDAEGVIIRDSLKQLLKNHNNSIRMKYNLGLIADAIGALGQGKIDVQLTGIVGHETDYYQENKENAARIESFAEVASCLLSVMKDRKELALTYAPNSAEVFNNIIENAILELQGKSLSY